MNWISWLHSSLGALCRGSIHEPVLGQVPRTQTCLAVGSGPFLLRLEVNYPEELGGRGRWIDASLQGRLRGTGGAAQPGKHWAGWGGGCDGQLDTDPWKDGGDDKHRTVSTGP